jgi:hypothetical protein
MFWEMTYCWKPSWVVATPVVIASDGLDHPDHWASDHLATNLE